MIRFLADESFPRPSVVRLRHERLDVAIVEQGASDDAVLARGASEGRLLLTLDRDFGRLVHQQGLTASPGVVYFRLEMTRPELPAERLLELLRDPRMVLVDRFTTVRLGLIRQRILSRR